MEVYIYLRLTAIIQAIRDEKDWLIYIDQMKLSQLSMNNRVSGDFRHLGHRSPSFEGGRKTVLCINDNDNNTGVPTR